MKKILILAAVCTLAPVALAKLPAPSDEAKAKAAEAAAKTAWSGKVADYQLCRSRERTAAFFFKSAKAAGKETRPPVETPACADPGAFAYTPAAAGSVAASPVLPAPASAAPAVPAAAPAKKS